MNKKIILLAIISFTISINSQKKVKLVEGNVENLMGVNEYNVVFDYSNITIPNYESEEDFLKDKIAIREEKEEGLGEKFKESWFADRENLYEPKFIEIFNDYFTNKVKIKVEKNSNLEYTILVNTVFLYPGYNVGVWYEDSKLKAVVSIYETENPVNIIFTTSEIYTRGRASYNAGGRISNAYGLLGRRMAAYLRKKTF